MAYNGYGGYDDPMDVESSGPKVTVREVRILQAVISGRRLILAGRD